MITGKRAGEIVADWARRTPEEKARIREQADQLRAESESWGPFYGDSCLLYHGKTMMQAEGLIELLFPGESLEECAWPALELAILEELRSPAVLAWDRAAKHLLDAIADPVVQENQEAVNVLMRTLDRIDWAGFGHSTADDVDPPSRMIAEWAHSRRAAEVARMKNAEPREWVREQWAQCIDPGQSKASFARQHVPLVKRRFGVDVTEDTIKRDWLPKPEK